MNLKKAIEIIKQYNNWRRDNDDLYDAVDPKEIGYALDEVANIDKYFFEFAKYLTYYYDYIDNTKKGNLYVNVATKKIMTEKEIYEEWLKNNT